MYAQDNILCQFGLIICHSPTYSFLNQFSSIFGGNCINGEKAWLGQPTIIKSLEKQFGERVAKKKMTVTPGTPEFIDGKVDDISKVDEKTQSM